MASMIAAVNATLNGIAIALAVAHLCLSSIARVACCGDAAVLAYTPLNGSISAGGTTFLKLTKASRPELFNFLRVYTRRRDGVNMCKYTMLAARSIVDTIYSTRLSIVYTRCKRLLLTC